MGLKMWVWPRKGLSQVPRLQLKTLKFSFKLSNQGNHETLCVFFNNRCWGLCIVDLNNFTVALFWSCLPAKIRNFDLFVLIAIVARGKSEIG